MLWIVTSSPGLNQNLPGNKARSNKEAFPQVLYKHKVILSQTDWLKMEKRKREQPCYSSQSPSFKYRGVSEASLASSTFSSSASVDCLLKVRWTPKCYLLFSFWFCYVPRDSHVFSLKITLAAASVLLVSPSSPSCFSNSLSASLSSQCFIWAIPWSFMLKRHDLTASFQESQMKWAQELDDVSWCQVWKTFLNAQFQWSATGAYGGKNGVIKLKGRQKMRNQGPSWFNGQ